MALPRVLVLGDSFIRRLRKFVLGSPQHFNVDFHLSNFAVIKWHGIGGRTVTKTVQHDLHMIKSFKPDIVIVQLGSNDLTSETALRVGASKDDFLRLLHDLYHVQVIYVCKTVFGCVLNARGYSVQTRRSVARHFYVEFNLHFALLRLFFLSTRPG